MGFVMLLFTVSVVCCWGMGVVTSSQLVLCVVEAWALSLDFLCWGCLDMLGSRDSSVVEHRTHDWIKVAGSSPGRSVGRIFFSRVNFLWRLCVTAIVLYCSILYSVDLYCIVLNYTVLYYSILYCTVFLICCCCCAVQFCITLYCFALYCIVLYNTMQNNTV